jgi:hypothetical protein
VEIEQENCIKFFMVTEFCEFSPEIKDHFEIFENIGGFDVTFVTSASSKEDTSLLWSVFLLRDEGEITKQEAGGKAVRSQASWLNKI